MQEFFPTVLEGYLKHPQRRGGYTVGMFVQAALTVVFLTVLPFLPCQAEVSTMSKARIFIKTSAPIGEINPNIYGHFTEHLGGVIYDGIWVGPNSKVPNINGIRKDLVDYMKRIKPAVVRWPGGCFADKYHWMDGIGPEKKRPKRYGRWGDVSEPNSFGTHEFLEFCKLIGAEPYLAGNVGTGTSEEFQSWIEYCNAPAGKTAMALLREKNGHKEPFHVKYWGVGNEAWGCGGSFTPEDYCKEYRKFSTWLPAYGEPLFLIGCGPSGNDTNWTKRFFDKFQDYKAVSINGWAPHYYCGSAGSALKFSEDQWYELIARGAEMDKLIRDQWQVLAEHDPTHQIKLVVDEWGCWHPGGTEINKAHMFEQMSTLRDAMIAAMTLDTFNRHCDKVVMSNVAQLINNLHSLFLADGPKFVATPNFYVYEMYKAHQGAVGLQVTVDSPIVGYKTGNDVHNIPALEGSASRKGKVLHLSVTNVDAHNAVEAEINLEGVKVKSGNKTVLTHKRLNAHNTFERPNEVVSVSSPLEVAGAAAGLAFAPASITMLEFELE